MLQTIQWIIAILVISLSVYACQVVETQRDEAFLHTPWTLTSRVVSGNDVATAQPGDYTFTVLPDGVMTGTALCNQCGGTYTLEGSDRVSLSLFCTEKGCPGFDHLEGSFFPYGEGVYEINGSVLEIRLDNGMTYWFRSM